MASLFHHRISEGAQDTGVPSLYKRRGPLVVFGLGLAALAWFVFNRPFGLPQRVQPTPLTTPPPALVARELDGVLVSAEHVRPLLAAVSVDNFVNARPQSGLDRASVIIEAPAEAAITRFLALFPLDEDVREIGPIRSARPYFIDWSLEYHAPLIHVGGSPAALRRLAREAIRQLDEWRNEAFIWRAKKRPMPHNVYTSTENLRAAFAQHAWEPTALAMWSFKDDASVDTRGILVGMAIPHREPSYRVHWTYDHATNFYARSQGESPHLLADGQQLTAKNVVVQFSKIAVLDAVGRREIETVGEGKAIVSRDGEVIEGTWARSTLADRTRFFDAEGKEITLNRGLTWITVVPDGTAITIEK